MMQCHHLQLSRSVPHAVRRHHELPIIECVCVLPDVREVARERGKSDIPSGPCDVAHAVAAHLGGVWHVRKCATRIAQVCDMLSTFGRTLFLVQIPSGLHTVVSGQVGRSCVSTHVVFVYIIVNFIVDIGYSTMFLCVLFCAMAWLGRSRISWEMD